jgi:hypothetical protein
MAKIDQVAYIVPSWGASSYCVYKMWVDQCVFVWNQWSVWDEKNGLWPRKSLSTLAQLKRISVPLSSAIQSAATSPLSTKHKKYRSVPSDTRTFNCAAVHLLERWRVPYWLQRVWTRCASHSVRNNMTLCFWVPDQAMLHVIKLYSVATISPERAPCWLC